MKTLSVSCHIILTTAVLLLTAPVSAAALTIDAGQAQIKTVGAIQQGAWNLWSNGEWGDYVQVDQAGAYKLEIEAFGSPASGVWPRVTLNVDGDPVADVKIESRDLKLFTFRLPLSVGVHSLTLVFSNDTRTATEDRNLYLKRMTISPADGQVEPRLGKESVWQNNWAQQEKVKEQQVLSEADRSIEKFRKEDAVVSVKDSSGKAIPGADIKVELKRHEFLFGCNIFGFDRTGNPVDDETYKRRFAELFNFATTALYWRNYEPKPGQPNYDYTDKVVAWCRDHGIRVKGHPLLWANPDGIAPWIQGLPSPAQQRQRLTGLLTRYRGRIEFWEVVNEPGHWADLKIDDPYRWAHDLDPAGHLIVNDSNVLADGFPDFYHLLQRAIDSQVPFDGIGIQAHEPEYLRFPLSSVQSILEHYAHLGKDLYITEFTPESSGQPMKKALVPGEVWDEKAQADYAVRFYTVCFASPAVKGITWWDLSDRNSWRQNGGLLRADLSPKPAYLALEQLIHEKWTTQLQAQSDQAGNYSFRGFRGSYVITVQYNGRKAQQEFTLNAAGPKTLQVVVPEKADSP
jgi:endo-1,4-beta-xylanase